MDGQNTDTPDSNAPWQFRPSDSAAQTEQTQPDQSAEMSPSPVPAAPADQALATPEASSANPAEEQASSVPAVAPSSLSVSPDQSAQPDWSGEPSASAPIPADESINWTASEFVAHAKSGGWYALLLLVVVVAALLVWLVSHDIVSIVVIMLAGAVLGAFAARKPRQVDYALSPHGLTIGQRHFNLHDFRSFAVVQEGAFSSLVLRPIKRFGFLTTVYYEPKDENKIIDIVSRQVPHEDHRPDAIESLMRRIHF